MYYIMAAVVTFLDLFQDCRFCFHIEFDSFISRFSLTAKYPQFDPLIYVYFSSTLSAAFFLRTACFVHFNLLK